MGQRRVGTRPGLHPLCCLQELAGLDLSEASCPLALWPRRLEFQGLCQSCEGAEGRWFAAGPRQKVSSPNLRASIDGGD